MAAVSIDPQRLRAAMDELSGRLDWLEPFRQRQYAAHPGLLLHLHRASAGHIILSKIQTTPRGEGIGERVLTELLAAADAAGDTVALTPTPEWGASLRRLHHWYRRHGFKPNRGRAIDHSITESWVRLPALRESRNVDPPAAPAPRPRRRP